MRASPQSRRMDPDVMATARSVPSPVPDRAVQPLFMAGLRPVGLRQSQELGRGLRRRCLGLGLAAFGHLQKPGVRPSGSEIHPNHVVGGGFVGRLLHARNIATARPSVTRNIKGNV